MTTQDRVNLYYYQGCDHAIDYYYGSDARAMIDATAWVYHKLGRTVEAHRIAWINYFYNPDLDIMA